MAKTTTYKGATYTLVERKVVGEDKKEHMRVLYADKVKQGDRQLDSLPKESWHQRLQKVVPITELTDPGVPPWVRIQPTLTEDDKKALAEQDKARAAKREADAKSRLARSIKKEIVKKVNEKRSIDARAELLAAKKLVAKAKEKFTLE